MDFYMKYGILVAVLCTLLGVDQVISQNNTSSDNSEITPLEAGLQPLYAMIKSFLETISGGKSLSSLFTELNITPDSISRDGFRAFLSINYAEVWRPALSAYVGYAVCVAIALACILFFIFGGLIICCCRCCCGNCGGRPALEEKKSDRVCRVICSVLLIVINTVLLAGMVCCFYSNELIRQLTTNSDTGTANFINSINSDLTKVKGVANSVVTDMNNGISQPIISTVNSILTSLEDVPVQARAEINTVTRSNEIITSALQLSQSLTTIDTHLTNIRNQTALVQSGGTQLTTEVGQVKTNVANALLGCTQTVCNNLRTQFAGLTTDADFSTLDTVDSQITIIQNLISQNLTALIQEGQQQFNSILNTVQSQTTSRINDLRNRTEGSLQAQVNSSLMEVQSQIDLINGRISEIVTTLSNSKPDVAQYGQYRWYACIGISCLLLLIVLFIYLGLSFGFCGEPAYTDSGACNRGVGANLLCAAVFFICVLGWILMIIVLVLFLAGSLTYTEVCRPLENEDVQFYRFVDSYLKALLRNNFFNEFSIENLFGQCKANGAMYSALTLSTVFNVSSVLNLDQYNIQGQFDQLKNLNFNLDNITILSTGTRSQLNMLANANLDAVTMGNFRQLLGRQIINADLVQYASDINGVLGVISEPQRTQLDNARIQLLMTYSTTRATLQSNMFALNNSVNALEATISSPNSQTFQMHTQNLINEFDLASTSIRVNGSLLIQSFLNRLVDNLFGEIRNLTQRIIFSIENDIGRCRPLYDIYRSLLRTGCQQVLNPYNGFWFSLGWFLIFSIPAIILCLVVSTYYKKTDEYNGLNKSFDDPNFDAYAGANPGDQIPLGDVQKRDGKSAAHGVEGHQNRGYTDRDAYPSSPSAPGAYGSGVKGSGGAGYQGGYGDAYHASRPPHSPPHYHSQNGAPNYAF